MNDAPTLFSEASYADAASIANTLLPFSYTAIENLGWIEIMKIIFEKVFAL
jgi:hypothetical protein